MKNASGYHFVSFLGFGMYLSGEFLIKVSVVTCGRIILDQMSLTYC